MTHYILLTNPIKCSDNKAGCHSKRAVCHNKIGGFDCKCTQEFQYGDGYTCFEDLNLLIIPPSEPHLHSEDFTFAKKLTIRIWLSHVTSLPILPVVVDLNHLKYQFYWNV